ncbi:MAG: WhiB family transcriptional regulator [Acidobacteria bacterium]|nr:WhiB family transcriptional regulator [Acidobacteriota bacterium]
MNQQLRRLQQDGRCSKEGSHELFFSERPAELAKAQRICARCEVRVRCLDVALQENLEWGVWGGVIFWDGQPYHRRRGRGRPRHAERNLPVEANRSELLELVKSA